MFRRYSMIVVSACVLLVGAKSLDRSAHQNALQSWREGQLLDAERTLRELLEVTDDPGLIAFNLGVMAADRGEFREAELHFVRALDDDEIPHVRRVRALYNRGTCLLHRRDSLGLRTAIQCFEHCLEHCLEHSHKRSHERSREAQPTDAAFVADVKHNLELAKLLWNQSRKKQSQPPTPNEELPEEPRPQPPTTTESTNDGNSPTAAEPQPSSSRGSPRATPTPSPLTTPAAGTVPVVSDASEVQRLTPEDTATLLDRIDKRLQTARRNTDQLRAGPERPNVRDW